MSTREDADRVKQELRAPGSSLLTVPLLAERTGLSGDEVRRAIEAHWREFRISPKPVQGEHLIGLIEDETDAQRTARLLRGIRGRLLGAREREDVTDDLARRILEAQERYGDPLVFGR